MKHDSTISWVITKNTILLIRISRTAEVFYKKGVHDNFAKFTIKHLRIRQLIENTRQLVENETLAEVFSCGFCKMFKNTFFTEHP